MDAEKNNADHHALSPVIVALVFAWLLVVNALFFVSRFGHSSVIRSFLNGIAG